MTTTHAVPRVGDAVEITGGANRSFTGTVIRLRGTVGADVQMHNRSYSRLVPVTFLAPLSADDLAHILADATWELQHGTA